MKNLLFSLLLLPTIIIGQTCTVSGVVVDSKDKPINNVRVKVGSSIAVYTDSEGTFSTKLSLRNHLNTRVKVNVTRRGYVTHSDNSLIITSDRPIALDKITLLREGETINPNATNTISDNGDLIELNDELINTNQDILNENINSFATQYQREIRDMEYKISDLEDKLGNIKSRLEGMNDAMLQARDKERFQLDLIEAEEAIVEKQERIIASQGDLIQALSVQSAKGIALDNAAASYLDNNSLEVSFQFKDAFGNRPTAAQPQLISIEVHQLQGKNRTETLLHMPEDGQLETSRLRERVDISRLNTVLFRSENAFKRKYRKKGYIIYFYLGETLLGVQGYRL